MKNLMRDINISIIKAIIGKKRIPPKFLLDGTHIGSIITTERLLNPYDRLSDVMKEKMNIYAQLDSPTSVILTGQDSIEKDLVAICILLLNAKRGKRVKYYSSPDIDKIETANATAFMRLNLLSNNYQTKKIAARLADIITFGSIFIVGVDTLEDVAEYLSTGMLGLMLSDGIELEVVSPEIKHIKL